MNQSRHWQKMREDNMDSDDDDNWGSVGGSGAGAGAGAMLDGRFKAMDDDEQEGKPDDASTSESDDEDDAGGDAAADSRSSASSRRSAKPRASRARKPKMFELAEGESAPVAVGFSGGTDANQRKRRREQMQPLASRLEGSTAAISGGASTRADAPHASLDRDAGGAGDGGGRERRGVKALRLTATAYDRAASGKGKRGGRGLGRRRR